MVGHMHEDVDALLGNLSKWLRKNNAKTVPGILLNLCHTILNMFLNSIDYRL